MKKWIICSSLIAVLACNHQSKQTTSKVTFKDRLTPEQNRCVQSEGDYLTRSYCIRITNKNNVGDEGANEVFMEISKFSNNSKIKLVGKEWRDDKSSYKIIGYYAQSGGNRYELDWRGTRTYFNIWDKEHQWLERTEPVIIGPGSIVDKHNPFPF